MRSLCVALLALAACSGPSRPTPARPSDETARAAAPRAAPSASASVHPSALADGPGSPAPSAPRLRTLVARARFNNPTPMVVDDDNVYVSAGGILLSVPKDGASAERKVFPTTQIVSALAADATDLYVGIYPADGPEPKGAIVRIDKKTHAATELARTKMLSAIAVDDENVWFGLLSDGAYRLPKKGGKPRAVFTGRGQVGAIAVDAERVYFGVTRYGAKQRAEIAAVERAGGAFSVFTPDTYDLMGLALTPSAVLANDNGTLRRFAVGGGPGEKISGAGSVVGVATRGDEAFFCDVQLGDKSYRAGVYRAGAAPALLQESPAAVGVAVDANAIYWADAAGGTLMALDLP